MWEIVLHWKMADLQPSLKRLIWIVRQSQVWLVLLVLLTACAAPSSPTPESTPVYRLTVPFPTATPTPIVRRTSTLSPSATATATVNLTSVPTTTSPQPVVRTSTTSPAPLPTWTPIPTPAGTILFIRLWDGNIYMLDAGCARLRVGCLGDWFRLTDNPKGADHSSIFAYDLSASLDGRWVAFTYLKNDELGRTQHADVHILDMEKCRSLPSGCTVDQTFRLTADPEQDSYGAAWSPTDDHLALVLDTDGDRSLAVMSADGSRYEVIFRGDQLASNANLGSPAWSPNGQRLAFTATYGMWRHADTYIFVVNKDGSEVKQITDFPHIEPYHRIDEFPQWSPDGQKILFISNHRHAGWEEGPEEFYLYTMNVDGSGITPLDIKGLFAVWSPDGSQILYVDEGGNLYVVDAEGGQPVQLTNDLNITVVTWIP